MDTTSLQQRNISLDAPRQPFQVIEGGKGNTVSVSTQRGRLHKSFDRITPETRTVHIGGHPYLWAIEKILARAENLESITVIPCMMGKVLASHRALCAQRNVQILEGHSKVTSRWKKDRPPRHYQRQRQQFLTMSASQRRRFETLLRKECVAAKVVARYFCLQSEPYLSQWRVGEECGVGAEGRNVSTFIAAIRYYLFGARVGKWGRAMARALRKEIAKRKKNGVPKPPPLPRDPSLPMNLPDRFIRRYRALERRWEDGSFDDLAVRQEDYYKVLVLRYGLNEGTPTFRGLRDVREMLGGSVTFQCIEQREKRALRMLGISRKRKTTGG